MYQLSDADAAALGVRAVVPGNPGDALFDPEATSVQAGVVPKARRHDGGALIPLSGLTARVRSGSGGPEWDALVPKRQVLTPICKAGKWSADKALCDFEQNHLAYFTDILYNDSNCANMG